MTILGGFQKTIFFVWSSDCSLKENLFFLAFIQNSKGNRLELGQNLFSSFSFMEMFANKSKEDFEKN